MTGDRRPSVVVVGGGISGLATAHRLARAGAAVRVLEATGRLGGKLHTEQIAGRCLDVGADAVLARRPHAVRLARELGLGDGLVAPATARVWLWSDDRLRPLPDGTVLGVPGDLLALARSSVLSAPGLARAVLEPLRARRPRHGDVAVGTLLRQRFGDELTEVLVEPLLGGVYAGSIDRLSLRAAAAPLAELAASGGSLVRAARARRRGRGADAAPVFLAPRAGMGRLVGALADELGERVVTDRPVRDIRRGPGGWRVLTDRGDHDAEHVVLAVPAPAASQLVGDLAPRAAELLAEISYASVATVTLGYARESLPGRPRGSGMLVPRREGRLIKAVTWTSAKWPHHAGSARFWMRASVGRIGDRAPLRLPDADLARRVDAEVRRAMQLRAPAEVRRVTRWPDALPQYEVGHLGRVAGIRSGLPGGMHVVGAAYDGLGVTSCVEQAERVAARIAAPPSPAAGERGAVLP